MTQFGGMGLGGATFFTSIPAAGNSIVRWNGRRNLINQLKRGEDFKDINFGKISNKRLNEINEIRRNVGVPEIKNRRVTIPADRVEHIYERRIDDNKYLPEEASDTIYKALFGKNSKIYPDKNYDTLQHFVNSDTKPSNTAIVGKIRNGDNIFVKTGFKK